MRTSIATVCLSGTLEEKLHASAEAGFHGVEIFEQDLVVSPHRPEKVRDLAARLGLSLDLYQPFRDFEGVEPDLLEHNLRRAEAKFQLMQRMGIDLALFCSNVSTATVDDDRAVGEQLRRLGDLADRYDVRVAYEALAWGRFISDFEHADRIVQAADHPRIGQCLDSFHVLSRNWSTEPLERLSADKIFFVQLADAPRLDMDVLSWSRHHRVFPGEGNFDLLDFLGRILSTGYDGPVSLEIFNDTFRQADPFRTAVDGLRALTWMEDRARGWLADRGRTSAVRLSALPVAQPPAGFDFIEVCGNELDSVAELLGQLGFDSHGTHRSKSAVELWTQGEARIILNQAPTSHPDPEIVGLGFDVADPLAASSRALQLYAHAVPRSEELGEEVLHAVRAPDGTEIFFAAIQADGQPLWAAEFGGGEVDPGATLVTRIDHVNLAQPWQHFDEAVLFYESVLSLEAEQPQDVPAPGGLVLSQSMRTEDGAIRLALNLAPGQNGEATPIYPQHIAFASSDIRALARRAAERGLQFLSISGNYYEDLAARFELEPAFLDELRELNLLFDRDATGDYLHFYTEAVGRVFFEVVERRAVYEGYGAPNAPARLAAQHRRRRVG
jgi:4-hydroxyphenylpyruvate dioxygenase